MTPKIYLIESYIPDINNIAVMQDKNFLAWLVRWPPPLISKWPPIAHLSSLFGGCETLSLYCHWVNWQLPLIAHLTQLPLLRFWSKGTLNVNFTKVGASYQLEVIIPLKLQFTTSVKFVWKQFDGVLASVIDPHCCTDSIINCFCANCCGFLVGHWCFTFCVLRAWRQLHGVLALALPAGRKVVAANCFVFVPFIGPWSDAWELE